MCLYCGEHMGKLWYFEPDASGPLVNLVDRAMYQRIVLPGLRTMSKRQPYGTERWTGVTRALWDLITSRLHGFQVVPDLDTAFAVIDKAHEVVLSICSCWKVLYPGEPEVWRCIGLNNAAKVTVQDNAQPWRPLTKDQAKTMIAEQRALGCFQTVGWRLGAHANWFCNCDQHCGAHRAPELEWGLLPSFFASSLVKAKACDGCRECARWCLRPGALTFDSKSGLAQIDQALCRGCGLCIEHCPTGALGYVPRRVIFDIARGRKVELPAEVLRA